MAHHRGLGPLLLTVAFLAVGLAAHPQQGDKTPKPLDAKELEKLWEELASDDAAKAFRAMGQLAGFPDQAVAYLKTKLQPVPAADPKMLDKLLDDLNSDQFAVRQRASVALEKLGDLAGLALRQKLENKPTLEMRKRIETLLEKLDGPVTQPDLLRSLRAVELLELIGTPQSKQALEPIAKGAPGHRVTEAAEGAITRLDKRFKAAGK
jgi:hypothetical protein